MIVQSIADTTMPLELKDKIKVPLTENQRQALASWGRDVVRGKAQGPEHDWALSAVLFHLNLGNYQVAAAELSKWCIVKGRANLHMRNKRLAEQELFLRQKA